MQKKKKNFFLLEIYLNNPNWNKKVNNMKKKNSSYKLLHNFILIIIYLSIYILIIIFTLYFNNFFIKLFIIRNLKNRLKFREAIALNKVFFFFT